MRFFWGVIAMGSLLPSRLRRKTMSFNVVLQLRRSSMARSNLTAGRLSLGVGRYVDMMHM